jgi:hypothetical protein
VLVVVFLPIHSHCGDFEVKKQNLCWRNSISNARHVIKPSRAVFFKVLQNAGGQSVLICPKVRLADIIKPTEKQNYQTALNKISRKHINFVLCDPATAKIFGVIELDDKSHKRADRVTRDAFVDSVFAAAGIQIIHFKGSASYSVEGIRQQLKSVLEH